MQQHPAVIAAYLGVPEDSISDVAEAETDAGTGTGTGTGTATETEAGTDSVADTAAIENTEADRTKKVLS